MSESTFTKPVIRSSKTSGKKHFSALIHSFSKAGKTLSASATSPKPVVLLTEPDGAESLTEENILKIFGDPANYENLNTEIDIIECFDWQTYSNTFDWLCDPAGGLNEYETWITDSISDLSRICLENCMKETKDPRSAYTDMFKWLVYYIEMGKAQEKNVLWLSHTERQEDQVDGVVRLWPWIEGKSNRNELPYNFSEIWFIDLVANPEGALARWLLTQEGGKGLAGSRNNLLDPYEALDFSAIFRKMARLPAWENPNPPPPEPVKSLPKGVVVKDPTNSGAAKRPKQSPARKPAGT